VIDGGATVDCPKCGAQAPDDALSCPSCGLDLASKATGAAAGIDGAKAGEAGRAAPQPGAFPPRGARRFAVVDAPTDLFAALGHGFSTHDQVAFAMEPGAPFPGGISPSRIYFVRDATADTFKVSTTRDGPAHDVSIAGSGYVTAIAVPSKPTPTWAYVLIGVAAAAVLALIFLFLPKDVTVPTIVGLSQADATATVEKDKLTLEVAGTEYSTVYPEGSVVVQYPEAGTRATKGSTVEAILSTQSKQVTMPDITGQKFLTGMAALRTAGLKLAPIKAVASDKPLGTILEQDPKAGTTVDVGSVVTLTASKGAAPAPVPVPNLVGMEESVALSIVDALSLESSTQDVDSARPKGEVVKQYPDPGTVMDPGSTVTLSISRGNQTTTTTAPSTTTTVQATTTTAAPSTTTPPTTEPPTTEPPTTETPTTEPPTTDTTEPLPPSNILYEADWSGGMNGWSGTSGWTTTDGMLVNNGEGSAETGTPASILAPYQPDTPDYTIVAVIALTGTTKPVSGSVRAFGQVARYTPAGAYTFGCGPDPGSGLDNLFVANPGKGEPIVDNVLGQAPFDPGTDFHTYRFEVNGSTITVSVDSSQDIKVTDDRYTSAGQVGLWAAGTPISVKSFKIYRVQ
jgi:beta-lactam-binding protein with PASTA domain